MLAHPASRLSPLLARAPRALSSTPPRDEKPAGSAYAVLDVGRSIDDASLRIRYRELATKWHPDRHQGDEAAEAERRFQEISEAFQVLSNANRRIVYDAGLDVAASAGEREQAAKRYRATSWKSEVPDIASRLRNAKRDEAGFPPHMIAGALALVAGNFVLAFSWLAG